MGFGDSRILRDTHVYIFIYIYTHLSTSNIYSSSFFDNIYIYPGENYLSDWPFLGRSLETKTINPQLYPTGVENPFVDFFSATLLKTL
jgi:hypothetical protein